jgi:hypothetical protein
MISPARSEGAEVVVLRSHAQITREREQEIALLFPGWKVWCTSTGTWNAYRRGEEPYFGRSSIVGRAFMVSAYSADGLISMLHDQVRIDLAVEFPNWRLRRTLNGWAAFSWHRDEIVGGAMGQLVQRPTISGLQDALWTRLSSRAPGAARDSLTA